MGMKRRIDAPPGVGADDQAWHPRPVAKLGAGVAGGSAARPPRHVRRVHVIVPPTPVVPRNEDDRAGPQRAGGHVAHALDGPLPPRLDDRPAAAAERRMLALPAWGVQP